MKMKTCGCVAALVAVTVGLARGALADVTLELPRAPEKSTALIQRAIDETSAAGGGKVVIPAGRYLTGGIFLKDNVTLHLAEDAVLLGSTNETDYVRMAPPATSSMDDHLAAVVGAKDAKNIALEGKGVIDGQGETVRLARLYRKRRQRNVLFYRCRDIRIEGVTLRNSPFWTCYLKECDGAVIRGVTIDGHGHWNNDGIDIDAKNVLVENCLIDVVDDGICPKSSNPDFIPENIEVRNCRIASNCNFIKFGTACYGGFRNCRIHDCKLVPCRISHLHNHCRPRRYGDELRHIPGVAVPVSGLSAVAIEAPDGGKISGIHVWNLDFTEPCVQTPVFIRLERRHLAPDGSPSVLEDILIENLKGTAVSQIASPIAGVPGLKVRNVTLRNIDLTLRSGGTLRAAATPVPEKERAYPDAIMFDRLMLPAYGFYIRHAEGIHFENVKLRYAPGFEERPPVVEEDTADVTFKDCDFQKPTKGPFSDTDPEALSGVEAFAVGCINCGSFHYGKKGVAPEAYAKSWQEMRRDRETDLFFYEDVGKGDHVEGEIAAKGLDIRADAAGPKPYATDVVELPRTIDVGGKACRTPRYRALRLLYHYGKGTLAAYGLHLVAEGHIRERGDGELSYSQQLRQKQFKALLEDAKKFDHAIFCGDFNAQKAEEYAVFTDAGYRIANCSERFGTTATLRNIPADNIIVSPTLDFQEFCVPGNYTLNTDHRPLLAIVTPAR